MGVPGSGRPAGAKCPGAWLACAGCPLPLEVPKAPRVPGLRCAGSGRRGGSGGEVRG